MPRVAALHKEFPSDADAAISATVKALASGRRLNVTTVGLAVGLKQGAIYDKLKGESPWKASEVQALATYFGVRVNDLYDGLGGRFGPPTGPLAQLAELRTFNPLSPHSTAKVLKFPLDRRRHTQMHLDNTA